MFLNTTAGLIRPTRFRCLTRRTRHEVQRRATETGNDLRRRQSQNQKCLEPTFHSSLNALSHEPRCQCYWNLTTEIAAGFDEVRLDRVFEVAESLQSGLSKVSGRTGRLESAGWNRAKTTAPPTAHTTQLRSGFVTGGTGFRQFLSLLIF